jgi:hypothetical protein
MKVSLALEERLKPCHKKPWEVAWKATEKYLDNGTASMKILQALVKSTPAIRLVMLRACAGGMAGVGSFLF